MEKWYSWLWTAAAGDSIEPAAVIRGERCRSTAGFFTEWSRALGFAQHFGRNWNAFADSLTETVLFGPEQQPAETDRRPTIVLVENAEYLLADEADVQFVNLIGALRDVAIVRPDDEDAVCFRDGGPRLVVVARDSPGRTEAFAERMTALGYAPVR